MLLALPSVAVTFLLGENMPTHLILIASICTVSKDSGKILLKLLLQSLLNPSASPYHVRRCCLKPVYVRVHSLLKHCCLLVIRILGCCVVISLHEHHL